MSGTWTIRGLTQGLGTDYVLDDAEIGGLGFLIAGNEVAFSTGDGAFAGHETYSARVLSFPMVIAPPVKEIHLMTPAERRNWSMSRLHTLTSAWRRIDVPTEGYEIPLDLTIDGISPTNTLRFYGRPRTGLAIDGKDLHTSGSIRVLAQFGCLDPFGYGEEVTDTLTVGVNTVTNEGLAPTERWTAEFQVGSVNQTFVHEMGVGLDLTGTTITGSPYVADARWYTLTQTSMNDVFGDLSETSDFFPLLPGDNDITVAGDDVEFTYRPAWLI